MNKSKILEKYNLEPISYKKLRKVDIITTENSKYVIKKTENQSTYEYLRTRNFNNFLFPITSIEDNYEITNYLDDIKVPDEQRIEDLIYLTSILHTKTTFYKNVDLDYLKKIYEDQIKTQEYLNNYYLELQNIIESEVYMSPSQYLLIRNISNIYKCIIKSREMIDRWYELVKEKKKIRYVMNHGNLDKSHLIENNDIFLVSWDKAKINLPVYDLANLYKNNQTEIDLFDLLNIYQTKYELGEDEKYLFLSLVSLPPKLENKDSEFKQVKETLKIVEYANKISEVLWQDNTN